MIDLDRFADEFGLDLGERNPEPVRPSPPLSPVAERYRDELLHRIACARASLEMLEATLRNNPSNDVAFDAIDHAFSENLVAARDAFQRWRDRRECTGEA